MSRKKLKKILVLFFSSHGTSLYLTRKNRRFYITEKNCSNYITAVLEDDEICRPDKIIVIIGNMPKLTCLEETEVTQRCLSWCSTNEVKQYSFKAKSTTVLNLTNKAKTSSDEALKWYQQQCIAAFLFVVENRFDRFSFQLLNRSVSGGSSNCFVIEFTYMTVPLFDISQFCKGLQNQTDALCNRPLVLCPQLDQYKRRITDGIKCNLSEMRDLIAVLKAHVDARPGDFSNEFNLFECHLEAFQLLFLEYFEHVKCGDRKQAVATRQKVADMLQYCSNSLHKQLKIIVQNDKFDYSYLCIQYAKWSLWLNPDLSSLNETVIDICQKSKIKLEQEKVHATKSYDHGELSDYVVPEKCFNLIRVYENWTWTNLKNRVGAVQKLDLIGAHQVICCLFSTKILAKHCFVHIWLRLFFCVSN